MSHRMLLLRGLCIVALAASSASFADQSFGDGAFCGFESGCEAVTSSAYGKVLGIPWPVVGIIGFTLILALTLIGTQGSIRIARWMSLFAPIVGIVLIVIQLAVLAQVCLLCLVADVSAVLMGVVCIRPLPPEPPSSAVRGVASVVAVLAALVPIAFAYSDVQPDPPDWVKVHWVPNKVTVVEVTDFECEHCRRADEYLRGVLKTRNDVNFVRIPIEMPKHSHSRAAAIAFRGAKAQSRETEMAEALFASPALTGPDCRAIAEKLGLDMVKYDRVVTDPATDAEVSAVSAAARAAGPGVPLIWIQSHVIFGSPTLENFDAPLSRTRPLRPQ
jgi:uncharacterized membrane protein/2-hydroxychromene-2-carboxylate isomerase